MVIIYVLWPQWHIQWGKALRFKMILLQGYLMDLTETYHSFVLDSRSVLHYIIFYQSI